MSKEIKLTIKAVRRAEPDLQRLARLLLSQIRAERQQGSDTAVVIDQTEAS